MIESLFTVVNSLLFWSLAVWFVHRSLLPRLLSKYQEIKERKKSLDTSNQQALAECRRLHEDLKNQESLFNRLDKKIILWRSKVEETIEKQKSDFEILQEKRLERRKVQLDYLVNYKVIHQLLPTVFEHARESLTAIYADSRKNHEYQKKVLHTLRSGEDV